MEDYVRQLALQQRAAGMVVRIVTLDRIFDQQQPARLAAREWIDRLEVVRLPWWGSKRYPIARGVLPALADADLVHVHGVDFFCDFLAATRGVHRKRLVLSTHGGFFHTPFAARAKRWFFHLVTRRSLRGFAAIIPSSISDEVQFRAIRSDGLETVENGVDLDKFEDCADPTAHTMIYFGRLAPNKGLDRLIDWFAEVHRQDPSWRLILAGRPMGVEPDTLASQVRLSGIAEAVEIHPWPTDAALRALIGRSSVYVCASAYEGFGIAAVEAMAAGLYPVLSDIPAFRRTLARAGYGTLATFASNPDAVAQTLAGVEAGLRGAPDAARRRRRLAPFGWAGAAEAIGHIYLRALGRSRRRIGRVSITVSCRREFLRLVDRTLSNPQRPPLFVAFCNAHTANTADRDPAFAAAMAEAVVVNDGLGIDLASSVLFGKPFQENLAGTDLVDQVLERTAASLRVFLVGSAPGVAEHAARVLRDRVPRHRVVGTAHGFFTDAETPDLVARIRASGADLVLVGMGHPRQEIWCATHYRELGAITMAIGAYLDFLAGEVRRAPHWMRRVRCEWIYRLVQEPRRLWRRYLVGNLRFLARLVAQWYRGARI
ncbi:WecB/TagA/CpsF family glycosyltransferase [Sphingomonas desiccabilis]|nr:WecB/TagA/CpsF family glycosyltransferase [Sphingomonas desiccabilis]MBB3911416.1 alpha-1,3-mannosyltransferase [Sphingomonas desiccabilis]